MYRLDISKTALQLLQEKITHFNYDGKDIFTEFPKWCHWVQCQLSSRELCYIFQAGFRMFRFKSGLTRSKFLDFKQDTVHTSSSTHNFQHWTPGRHNMQQEKTSQTCQIVKLLFDVYKYYLTCLLTDVTQMLLQSTQIMMY